MGMGWGGVSSKILFGRAGVNTWGEAWACVCVCVCGREALEEEEHILIILIP